MSWLKFYSIVIVTLEYAYDVFIDENKQTATTIVSIIEKIAVAYKYQLLGTVYIFNDNFDANIVILEDEVLGGEVIHAQSLLSHFFNAVVPNSREPSNWSCMLNFVIQVTL